MQKTPGNLNNVKYPVPVPHLSNQSTFYETDFLILPTTNGIKPASKQHFHASSPPPFNTSCILISRSAGADAVF
jgi:hypothetical protein